MGCFLDDQGAEDTVKLMGIGKQMVMEKYGPEVPGSRTPWSSSLHMDGKPAVQPVAKAYFYGISKIYPNHQRLYFLVRLLGS